MERQEAIKALVKKKAISDQLQVVELLQKEYRIATTQAQVSRDLRKLGVIKKLVKGVACYELPSVDVGTEILRLALMDMQHNEQMIVIKTQPGLAAFVGDFIDQQEDLPILGCLAGENVVFVTPKTVKNLNTLFAQLCERLHFRKD